MAESGHSRSNSGDFSEVVASPRSASSSGPTLGIGICVSPTLPLFAEAELVDRVAGNRPLVAKIGRTFLEDIPNQTLALKGYIEACDPKGTERPAHTIKGATAIVGGHVLRAVAAQLE